MLNAFEFDCLFQGQECSARSEEIRSDANFAIQKYIHMNLYPKVLEGLKNDLDKIIALICQSTGYYLFEQEGNNPLWKLAQIIESRQNDSLIEKAILNLAVQAFRRPFSEFKERIASFGQKYSNGSDAGTGEELQDCWDIFYQVQPRTTALIFALLESRVNSQIITCDGIKVVQHKFVNDLLQGGLNASLGLGNLFEMGYSTEWKAENLKENEIKALAKFQLAFDSLLEGTSLTISEISEYFTGVEYVGISLKKQTKHFHCDILHKIYTQYSPLLFCDWEKKEKVDDECCQLEREIQANYQTILRMFKYLYQPPSRTLIEKSELRDIANATDLMGYPTIQSDNHERWHADPAIIACRYGTHFPLTRNCTLFSKTFSTAGIAYTFNAAEFFSMYKENEHTQAFFREINEVIDEGHEVVHAKPLKRPYRVEFSGPAYGLEAFIRHGAYTSSINYFGKIEFAIHAPEELGM